MPTMNNPNNRGTNRGKKPWRARIKVRGQDLYLGYCDTYDEAKELERQARLRFPSQQGRRWLV